MQINSRKTIVYSNSLRRNLWHLWVIVLARACVET